MGDVGSSLPAENRVNLKGERICRWCSTRLEEHTYVPLKKRKRKVQLLCPFCDTPRVSWREEYDQGEPGFFDDGA